MRLIRKAAAIMRMAGIFTLAGMAMAPETGYAAVQTMSDGLQFDPVFYAAQYPDVAAQCGTDADALYQHFQTTGKYEGRLAYESAPVCPAFLLSEAVEKAKTQTSVAPYTYEEGPEEEEEEL